MNTVVSSEKAPAALGPYSQAIKTGNMLYISGQLGIDPKTGEFPGQDAVSQAKQSLANLQAILKAAGAGPANVVKTTVLLADINDFAAVNEVYSQVFTADPPARSCFVVAALPKGGKVEIEAIAAL